jgi:serine phosphatase RsbU (regulator of sigma subunit)
MVFKQLKIQLLFVFSVVIFLLVLTYLGSGYLYNQKNRLTSTIRELDDIRVLALKNFKLIDDYISYETTNENYFVSGESKVKKEFESNYFEIIYRLQTVRTNLNDEYSEITPLIDSLLIQEKQYAANFSKLEEHVLLKGFKDFGVEGRMRDYAHQLMEIENHGINYRALMLRRHEKDYIIRKDIQYFNKFNQEYEELTKEIDATIKDKKKKKQYHDIAYNYKKYFTDFYNLQFEIGLNEREGVLRKLRLNYEHINTFFDTEKAKSVDIESSFHKKLKIYNSSLIVLSILIALVLGYIYASRITKRVNIIKTSMRNYIESGFKDIPVSREEIKIKEFREMNENFLHMASEINSYINHFRIKVEERTAEIRWQKEEIVQQNSKISSQHELLQIQQHELAEKNRNFLESVRHAEKIQKALLPSHQLFRKLFADAFVFFQPRDIVSGDFYWLEEISLTPVAKTVVNEYELVVSGEVFHTEPGPDETHAPERKIVFALGDCTGHGVPGAFMSIVGINHLNRIVKESRIHEPDEILNNLNHEVKRSFYKGEDDVQNIKDGMDIAFCSYSPEKNLLQFAGANKNLLLLRNNHIYEFKGNKKPVGIYPSLSNVFEKTDIKTQEGDILYLFTDGYQDQFGGEKNKKFKTKNLKQLLLKIHSYPMSDQYSIIRDNFNNWKGEGYQVDDVCVIGIRL